MDAQTAQAWATVLGAVSPFVAIMIIFLRVYADFSPIIQALVKARLAVFQAALGGHVPLVVAITPPAGIQIIHPAITSANPPDHPA